MVSIASLIARLRAPDETSEPGNPSGPEGFRIYAIGDVHGRLDLFDRLMAQIVADLTDDPARQVSIILLGDLIDRGPASATVVERVVRLRAAGVPVRLLMGNHEEVMLDALDGNLSAAEMFLRIGGHKTMLSYGAAESDCDTATPAQVRDLLAPLVPPAHLALLHDAETAIELGSYIFVHAGVRPGVALEEQKPEDTRWIRGSFLTSEADHGKIVVHGHTVTRDPAVRTNRIGIDTGAYSTGVLTALVIDGETRRFLTAYDDAVQENTTIAA